MTPGEELEAAVDAVRPRLEGWTPEIALVLGSGLGTVAGDVDPVATIPFEDIPGLGAGRVVGHAGQMVAGMLSGRRVIAFAGRRHLYEGHSPSGVVLPVRLASALGASILLVTNAAGGIRRTFAPGTLMLIRDHINLTFRSPLTGPVLPGEERFPDLSAPYDDALSGQMRAAARALGQRLEEGVYAGLLGPTYETRAEVRMLERRGARHARVRGELHNERRRRLRPPARPPRSAGSDRAGARPVRRAGEDVAGARRSGRGGTVPGC